MASFHQATKIIFVKEFSEFVAGVHKAGGHVVSAPRPELFENSRSNGARSSRKVVKRERHHGAMVTQWQCSPVERAHDAATDITEMGSKAHTEPIGSRAEAGELD